MDLSALIFVALAGAWAVYLVPKALTAHEVDDETRSVDSFSDRMRILARREAGSAGDAELVVTGRMPAVDQSSAEAIGDQAPSVDPAGDRASSVEPFETPRPSAPQEPPVETLVKRRRAAAARAAARRRRVLGILLLVLAATCGLAGFGPIAWGYVAIPAALLVGWLVACRLMAKRERAARARQRVRKKRRTLADEVIAEEEAAAAEGPDTEEVPAVADTPVDERAWDPVPITLPTYVEKAPAGRTVRTIDLDATGVWSSGRNEADSQLAREAEEAEQAEKAEKAERSGDQRRATGS